MLLIVDLGRPERFLHMLRVFKPTSPLSVGSYILSPFSALTVATRGGCTCCRWFPAVRALKLARCIPGLRKAAAVGAAVFGGPMTTYTAVLLANTAVAELARAARRAAVPVRRLGDGRRRRGHDGAVRRSPRPGRRARWRVAGAMVELAAAHKVEHGHGIVSEPYHDRPGRHAAAGGEGVHGLRRRADRRSPGRARLGAVASGALLAAGSLLTRFGVFDAGMASAKDPKYTVIPQRERLAARALKNGTPRRHPLTPFASRLRATSIPPPCSNRGGGPAGGGSA